MAYSWGVHDTRCMDAGERLRRLRRELELSQEALALAGGSGLEQSTISRWELNGCRGMTLQHRIPLGKGLGVDPTVLGEYLDGHRSLESVLAAMGRVIAVTAANDPKSTPVVGSASPEHYELALLQAIDPEQFAVADFDAVRTAVRAAYHLLDERRDAVRLMHEWLEAARWLRRSGVEVTSFAIVARATSICGLERAEAPLDPSTPPQKRPGAPELPTPAPRE
jgi:transcriptional regulator with XRE-family HTH domain